MNVDAFLDWAYHGLTQSDKARDYLQGRGISESQMAVHRLGYIGDDYDVDPSQDANHGEDCLDREKKHLWCDSCHFRSWSSTWEADAENGPKSRRPARRIHDCVVFPLTSYSGTHVGFQVRHLDKKEYDTFALHRRPEGFFFCSPANISAVWSTQTAYLVEGPGDHMIYERLVAPNVLGLTTSGVSKLQLRFLHRFAKKIVLVLDRDEAGIKGARSFIQQHQSDFEISVLQYPCLQPKDKDPGDYWKRVGDDKFRSFFKRALAGAT
jgi:DNA primase